MPNKLLRKSQFEHVIKEVWKKARAKFAKLDEDNYFTGKNIFDDLNVIDSLRSEDYTNKNYNQFRNGWSGLKNITTNSVHGYVSKIRIYVPSSSATTRNDFNVWVVNVATNQIEEKLTTTSLNIVEVDANTKYFDFPVNRSFENNSYFIVGSNSSSLYVASAGVVNDSSLEHLVFTTTQPTGAGTNAPTTRAFDYVVRYEVHGAENVKTSLDKKVETWDDLDYVSTSPSLNIYNVQEHTRYDSQYILYTNTNRGAITGSQQWNVALIPCKTDEVLTIVKTSSDGKLDTSNLGIFDSKMTFVSHHTNITATKVNGRLVQRFTVPSLTSDTGFVAINMYKDTIDPNEVMIFSGNISNEQIPTEYIPHANSGYIYVDGSMVVTTFDSTGTDLKSSMVSDAIKEVSYKATFGSVSKNKPDVATSLMIDNLSFSNPPLSNYASNTTPFVAENLTLTGNKTASVGQNVKVTNVQIGVRGYNEGDIVTGIELYVATSTTNVILERIVYDGIAVVRKSKAYESSSYLFVDIPVNKSFGHEVFFLARIKGNSTKGMWTTNSGGVSFNKTTEGADLTNTSIPITTGTMSPNIVIYGEGVNMRNAFVDVDYDLGNDMTMTFTKADGTKKIVSIANGDVTTARSKAGEVKTFVYDISRATTINSKTSLVYNGQVINGDAIEIDGQTWLKCDGQQFTAEDGQVITLPTSKDGQYMFMCLG